MKRIFLTGASSGIGLATARILTDNGYEVWGTSREPHRLPQLERFHPVRLDLRETASLESNFAAAAVAAGHFDVIINNAGSGRFGPAELFTPEDLADEFGVLVFAQIRLMQLGLAHLREQGTGCMINVTSLASRLPVPFMAAYNAAKAAMAIFTMTTQLELPRAIHLVDLQPADICTDFNNAVTRTKSDQVHADSLERTWRSVDQNLRNAPKPDLVARRILRLIEEENPPPRVTVGNFFQATIAPLIFRFIPSSLRIWGLKKYYGLP